MFRIKKLIQSKIGKFIVQNNYGGVSFSQHGEDLVIYKIFESAGLIDNYSGYYVDLGGHHPLRHSNTMLLHLQGWSGLNIDANQDSIDAFDHFRPNDTNICAGVSDKTETLVFYSIDGDGMSTFDPDHLSQEQKNHIYKTEQLQCHAANELFERHIPSSKKIDYLNIDLEGFDQKVLTAIDFSMYRPKIISIELLGWGTILPDHVPTIEFLTLHQYAFVSRCGLTSIFVDSTVFAQHT